MVNRKKRGKTRKSEKSDFHNKNITYKINIDPSRVASLMKPFRTALVKHANFMGFFKVLLKYGFVAIWTPIPPYVYSKINPS